MNQTNTKALEKATITNQDTKQSFKVLFNPTDYTVAKNNTWEPKKVVGKNVPPVTFTGGQSKTLKMKLFFDVAEEDGGDVRTSVDKLWELVHIDEKRKHPKTGKSRPPLCLFQWGPDWQFEAALTALSVNYTLFRGDGMPLRAMADVSFLQGTEDKSKKGKKTNPSSYAEPGSKRRAVQPRDTLALIAFQEYGDSTLWRRIADENKIDDPLDLRPGQILAIPPGR